MQGNPDSRIREIFPCRIQNLSSTNKDKNPGPGIWNPQPAIQARIPLHGVTKKDVTISKLIVI